MRFNLSKFERHKKQGDSTTSYVYPHKHCSKCGEMIEESLTYCPQCYLLLKQGKKKKFLRKSKATPASSSMGVDRSSEFGK